jgi:Flp pilus assembly protein TadG
MRGRTQVRTRVKTGPATAQSRSRAARTRRGERGSISLELVVVFPVLLAIVFGVVQGALYFHARNVALAAAQEGARAAGAEHGTAGDGGTAAWSFLTQAGGAEVMTQLDVSPHRSATVASVTVSGRALSVLPGIPGFTVSQTADRPVERFTTPSREFTNSEGFGRGN